MSGNIFIISQLSTWYIGKGTFWLHFLCISCATSSLMGLAKLIFYKCEKEIF